MDMTAVFELPVPIWMMCDALGRRYPTGFNELKFSVATPQDDPPDGTAPDVPGLAQWQPKADEQVMWTHQWGAFIPDSLRPATAVHRIAATDVDGPTPDHMSWFTPDAQLAEYINPWFDQVRTWAEIMTGQDLDPHHRVYDAQAIGTGLTFINAEHDGALGLTITTPRILPLRAQQWADILSLVRNGTEPPLEEVLSRDARAAHRRNATRRAIIDAATALEVALGRHVHALAQELPDKQRKRITDRTALGDWISIAEVSELDLAVPIERLRWVNRLRNDAAHRGDVPSHWDCGSAIQLAINFLSAHGRLKRATEAEPDGSEWIPVHHDNTDTHQNDGSF